MDRGNPKNIGSGNIGSETGVFISNLEIPYHEWNETEKKLVPATYQHEKVHCEKVDENLLGKEVWVINENTGLGEIVWVAPNSVSNLQTKIFDDNYTPNNICTSNVTNMVDMFNFEFKLELQTFNSPLNRWDTSKVTTMSGMFYYADVFNQPLNFNTSNVTDMDYMFWNATSFNQSLKFDTSKVKYIWGMFEGSIFFNNGCEEGIFDCMLKFNTSNVISVHSMFYSLSGFNQKIEFSDTSKILNMTWMFNSNLNFNQNINHWDVSNVTDMTEMFAYAKSFNQDLSGWCVSKIAYEPDYFDLESGFEDQISKQPRWGKAKVIETIDGRNSKCQIEQDNGTCNIYDLINQNSLINSNVPCQ